MKNRLTGHQIMATRGKTALIRMHATGPERYRICWSYDLITGTWGHSQGFPDFLSAMAEWERLERYA